MVIDKKEYIEEDDSIGYIETIFKSDNILKTLYFPKINLLYISFSENISYLNISDELYKEFESTNHTENSFIVKFLKKVNILQ